MRNLGRHWVTRVTGGGPNLAPAHGGVLLAPETDWVLKASDSLSRGPARPSTEVTFAGEMASLSKAAVSGDALIKTSVTVFRSTVDPRLGSAPHSGPTAQRRDRESGPQLPLHGPGCVGAERTTLITPRVISHLYLPRATAAPSALRYVVGAA